MEAGAETIPKDENEKKEWSQILSVLPEQRLSEKMNFSMGFSDRIIASISWVVLFVIFKIFWRLKSKGKNNLPAAGPYLICPNHGSYLDGFAVFASFPLRMLPEVFFLGYSKIFEHPLVHWAAKKIRLVSIDPNIHLTEAMQAVSFAIKHKKIVCIFPEGRRSIDNNVGEFKKGVGILIKELDTPVIPVYIKGSHYSWPRGSRFPRLYPLEVIFGPKRFAQELVQRTEAAGDKYQAISRNLREEVLKLAC
jgi:long-chain acyl-CoA synthetase